MVFVLQIVRKYISNESLCRDYSRPEGIWLGELLLDERIQFGCDFGEWFQSNRLVLSNSIHLFEERDQRIDVDAHFDFQQILWIVRYFRSPYTFNNRYQKFPFDSEKRTKTDEFMRDAKRL